MPKKKLKEEKKLRLTKSKKTIILTVIAATLCLVLSSFLPAVHSQTSSNFTLPCTINAFGSSWDGAISFDLAQTGNGTVNALVVMDTNGTLLNLRESDSGYDGANYNIAADTLMFEGEPSTTVAGTVWSTCATHFWNFITNTTQDFPSVLSEHDIQYDPVSNTFLTLQDYVRQIGNNSILFDKILQVAPDGTVLWSWDTYNYIPLSEASPFNETAATKITGQTVEDVTHANSIDWDYNNGVIYLNLRATDTFYKIDQATGDIVWACGEFGNFTLLDENGSPVSSLWYHSHDVKEVAPDVFTMFDNDFDNNTNPDNCHSRMIEVTLNETNMTAYVNWSWEAPTQYWNTFGGATVLLPNGDYLGDFGDPTHQLAQNKPWNFNDTGAVLVEVNPAGQIVKTFTFPVGWYIYRVEAITNLSSAPNPTPTPTPTSTKTPNVTPHPSVSPSFTPVNPTNSQATITNAVLVVVIVGIATLAIILYLRKTRKI